MSGAAANVAPVTSTRAICIENPRRFHTPPPQLLMTSVMLCWHTGMATKIAIKVRIIAKMNGSGRYFCMKLTQPFIIL